MEQTPKISVIMPVYNAEKYIRTAVESILCQTEGDFELIIIDDCGKDSSMDIVKDIKDKRICIVGNEKNMGIAYSRNRGLKAARGKYIALMDDDDIASLNRFEVETRFLDEHEDIAVVGGGVLRIDENGKIISYLDQIICNPKRIRAELIFRDIIGNGSTMMRTEFIRKNNLQYKDNYLGMEDYKFWTECSVLGNIANIDKVLLYWRESSQSETIRIRKNKAAMRKQKFAEIQKETLEMNGFELNMEDLKTFTQCFSENKREYMDKSDLDKVFHLLNKLIVQGRNNHLENIKEFEIVCHKMFALKTENSSIWEAKCV